MPHPLDNLCGPGRPLQKEAPDADESAGLLRSGTARLKDARNITLALESRFDLAYNAAHSLSLAALRRRGYRAEYEGLLDVDERLVTDLIAATQAVADALDGSV